MSQAEVRTTFLEDLAEDYHGDTYHLIARNCNHFTADACKHVTGKPTPGWVNRLARLALCSIRNSMLTENIKVSAPRTTTTSMQRRQLVENGWLLTSPKADSEWWMEGYLTGHREPGPRLAVGNRWRMEGLLAGYLNY